MRHNPLCVIIPQSSILRTIPVDFIYTFLPKLQIVLLLSVFVGEIYRCRFVNDVLQKSENLAEG